MALASNGTRDGARPLFARAFTADARWRELRSRLPGVDQLPKDPELLDEILSIR